MEYLMKKSKMISFTGKPGKCIVPVCSEENMHYFGLFDRDGNKVMESVFKSLEYAKERAEVEFSNREYSVKDLDEEWYITTALRYRKRIKQLHPSFRSTNLVLDMSQMYYSRQPNDWYTYIPFDYNGVRWEYRETASNDWIHKLSS